MTERANEQGIVATVARMDDATLARLIDGSVILAAFTFGGLSRRLRLLGIASSAFLTASAFTGWTPSLHLVRSIRMGMKQPEEPGPAEPTRAPEVGAALGGAASAMRHGGHHRHMGVPSRVPDEIGIGAHHATGAPGHGADDPDERSAPSVDGDLGLAD